MFRHKCMYKQPTLTKYWNYKYGIIWNCKYYIVISDTLVGFFLDVLFLLLAVKEKTKRNKD